MPVRMPEKALKLNAVAEYFDKAREEKERLISLLMKLVPDSLPAKFRPYLEKVVVPALLANGRYANYFMVINFGFESIESFEEKIMLLQEAWKGMIDVSFNKTARIPLAVYMVFDPVL
jgi:hypothetical protein